MERDDLWYLTWIAGGLWVVVVGAVALSLFMASSHALSVTGPDPMTVAQTMANINPNTP